MKNILIARSSNRSIDEAAHDSVARLVSHGAALLKQRGSSEVAHARNVVLTQACGLLKRQPCPFDVVLMVDDDMVFPAAAAAELVSAALAERAPASACYALATGRIPAERLPSGRFRTGLGLLAVPALLLLELEARSNVYTDRNGDPIVEFTWSASELTESGERIWRGEDFRLTERLGGALLLPISVGHLKQRTLLPAPEDVAELCNKEIGSCSARN